MTRIFLISMMSLALWAQPTTEIVYRFHSDMVYPTDVAVLNDGRICVADGVNQRVLVFKKNGRSKELKFPEMKRPLGLAADLAGGLLITDTETDVVLILDKRLKLKSVISLPKVVDATDVQVIDGQVIWVVDNDGHRVIIMDRQGNIESEIGRKGSSGPTFNYPACITRDGRGQLYVTDVLNGRVQLFNEFGTYQGQVAKWGITPGSLYRPKGIAANQAGAFVISDSFTGTIHYYKSQGSQGEVLKTHNQSFLRLENPLGLCWDKNGLLWIVESGSGDLLGVKLN